MEGPKVMKRNRLELWFRINPPADLAGALLQTNSDEFLVCGMNWPAVEIDTTRDGLVALVRRHLNFWCRHQGRKLPLNHGSMIVVPGTDTAVMVWNLKGSEPHRGFVPVNDTGMGYYLVPIYGRLDHPCYRSYRTADTVFVAGRGAGSN
jgi:hypothetical protein